MAKQTISMEVSRETFELASGLANIVRDCRTALADGWQSGSDLPAILLSAVQNLGKAMQGAEQIKSEWSDDKAATVMAALYPVLKEIGSMG
jgi:hypothetical protein